MPLTNKAIENAKPKDKAYKLSDGDGMYLYVTPKGQKYWRLDYRFEGKRKTLALGVFPEVSLKKARERRGAARTQLTDGIDPALHRKAEKLAKAGKESFEAIAHEWFEKFSANWAPSHSSKIKSRLE